MRIHHTRFYIIVLLLLFMADPIAEWAAAQAPTTRPDDWRQDLQVLSSQLASLHPNFFVITSRDDFNRAVATVNAAIPSMSDSEIMLAFAQITALGGDAHTNLMLTQAGAGFGRFPIRVRWFSDGLFVIAAAPQYQRAIGRKILSIGSVPIGQAFNTVSGFISSENEPWRRYLSQEYLVIPEIIQGLRFVPSAQRATYMLEGEDGAPFVLELTASPRGAGLTLIESPQPQPLYARDPRLFYWFHYFSESRTLFVKYNACQSVERLPFPEFANEVLRFVDENPIEQIVLDVRNNTGGNSSLINPLFEGFRDRILGGRLSLRQAAVFVDRATISSALMNALTAKQQGAIVVGEPTGGKPNHFGQVQSFLLPRSQLVISYSTRFFQLVSDDPLSLIPDVSIETAAADYFSGRDPVLEAMTGPPTTRATPVLLPSRGGAAVSTAGAGVTVSTGQARVSLGNDSAPSGQAIFSLRQNGVTVTEAAVPAVVPVTGGRIFVETTATSRTGVAFANPSSVAVSGTFVLTDPSGQDRGTGEFTVPPDGQLVRFLNEAPFNAPNLFQGALTFSASSPLGVVALRGFVNERSDFMLTPLPIAALGSPPPGSALLPHVADGGGWLTRVLILNPTDQALTGSLNFVSSTGAPLTVAIDGRPGSAFNYAVPPKSSRSMETSGSGADVRTGSATINPASGSASPVVTALLIFRRGGVTVAEAGVGAVAAQTGFRLFFEAAGDIKSGAAGSFSTGFGVANPNNRDVNVVLDLIGVDGRALVPSATILVPANGQRSLFATETPEWSSLTLPLRGVLVVTAADPIAVTGLRGRYNERGDFLITALPAVPLSSPPAATELIFPHFAEGGGYSTQFILMDHDRLPRVSGTIRFYSTAGTPIPLDVR